MDNSTFKIFLLPILLIVPIVLGFKTAEDNYQEIFADDYQYALQYIQQHKTELINFSAGFNANTSLMVSMAFPELIRYSKFQNMLELAALEILYVNYGCSAADFSIGPWQIKPSAIEKLEQFLADSISDNTKWNYIFHFKNTDEVGIRKERLSRIKNDKWQIIYLSAFCMVFQQKFKQLEFENKAIQVSFFASAYNHGYNCNAEEIKRWESAKFFPYGTKTKARQYAYSEIAVDFYKKYCCKYFN